MTDDSATMADTSDMYAIHRVFRNALDSADDLIGGASGDAQRAALVGTYYDNVLELLRVHHEGEDELVWPKLLQRLPDQADEVSRIAAQHHGLDSSLPASRAAVNAWAAAPDDPSAAAATDALTEVAEALIPHLDEEERVILPLAATVITAPEWGELPGHGMANFTGDKIWLILGLLRDEMTDEQKALMLSEMPPPAAEFWTTIGEGLYTDFRARLGA